MKNIIFLAPPAAGKGTFSEYLISNFNYYHISSGDLIREKALKDQDLASKLKQGMLIDDKYVMNLVQEKLKAFDQNKPFVLDGIPRTINQVYLLENIIDFDNVKVIYIDVNKDILEKRVTGRLSCPKCGRSYNEYFDMFKPKNSNLCDDCLISLIKRSDDNKDAFLKRYEQYINLTKPILDYFDNKGMLVSIQNNSEYQTLAFKKLLGAINDN